MLLQQIIIVERQIPDETKREELRALEIYIAGQFRHVIEDEASWTARYRVDELSETNRRRIDIARRALENHPAPSVEEVAAATTTLEVRLDEVDRRMSPSGIVLTLLTATLRLLAVAMLVLAVLGMVSTVAFKGGLMARVLGIEVVGVKGNPAILVRRLFRGSLVWGTVFVLFYPFASPLRTWLPLEYGYISFAIILGLAAWSVWHPARGVQDRIAGTYLVPR